MKNLKLYLSNCKKEILSGIQIEKAHSEYRIGKTLYASQDIGRERDSQEDSVIILEHPKNKKIKIIGVSDGVGGFLDGEKVSNHIVKKLLLWFEKQPEASFEKMDEIKRELFIMLHSILEDLEFNSGAATLSTAIIGKRETLIANIGDSRIYTYKDGKLTQETKDDSEVEQLFEEKAIPSEELKRFHKSSNMITQAIDFNPNHYYPHMKTLDNKSYDKIFAFSDGVTDCLSKRQIEEIIKSTPSDITSEIVNKALNNNSNLWEEIRELPKKERDVCIELFEILEQDYWQNIDGGKDNTTAAAYIKK